MRSSDPLHSCVPTQDPVGGEGLAKRRSGRWHERCDRLTEWLLWGMVVFSPWAFGTTQDWSMRVMNAGGYALGALWVAKLLLRKIGRIYPDRWEAPAGRRARLVTGLLGAITVLVLLYCLASAVNARATYRGNFLFDYFSCVSWLPHSYDGGSTWAALWNYLALALDFWAIRDWLLTLERAERRADPGKRSGMVPARLRRLLWVISVNGGVLAAQGLAQRALGGGHLLWLVEPRINKQAEAQFGPYAYRSNGVQYLLLVWPLALGFWLLLARRAAGRPGKPKSYNNLLPCILVMAMVPFMALSRAGAMIGVAATVAALGLVLVPRARGRLRRGVLAGTVCLLGAALLLGGYMEWDRLGRRFEENALDSSRLEIWRTAWQAFQDNAVFGTGPGSFSAVNYLYSSGREKGMAEAHNDWLELIETFGVAGSALVMAGLVIVLVPGLMGGGIYAGRTFPRFLHVALGSCLLYACVDFPLTVYSILFLFVVECAVLSSLARRM